MDWVDLYVDGAAFYAGSIANDLKNGWCNLRRLGATLAAHVFGTSVDIAAFYYLNGPTQPIITASYGELNRKGFFLGALRVEAAPIIIEHANQAETPRADDNRCALLIAAGRDGMSPLEIAVRARYQGMVALAVPPDLPESPSGRQDVVLGHADLGASPLSDTVYGRNELYKWSAYVDSKRDASLVSACYKDLHNVLLGFFENQLKKCSGYPYDLPFEIRHKLHERVERELRGSRLDRRLMRASRDFITAKMVAVTYSRLAEEVGIEQLPLVRDVQVGPRPHQVCVTQEFEKQLLKLEGTDPAASKLVRQKISDFRAGRGQTGLSLHRVLGSGNSDLWSLRVNRDYRIIAHYASGAFTPRFVGHHQEAYQWPKK